MSVNNKVVLVTGASHRIGAVIAKYFHQHGYNVIVHYRSGHNKSVAESFTAELNNFRANSAVCIQLELEKCANSDFSSQMVDQVASCFGRLDVLVNNASTFFATPIGDTNLSDWRDLMISNAGGPFFLSQALAKILKKFQGAIINISDIHAARPLKGYTVYSMAKAANNMLTKSLARELAPEIRVNAVAPGPTMWPSDRDGGETDELNQKMIKKTVLKRLGTPEDVAKTVFFLAENNSITGQIIAVDAGRSIKL